MKNMKKVILIVTFLLAGYYNGSAQNKYVSKVDGNACVEIELTWEGTTVHATRNVVECSPTNKMTFYNLTELRFDDNLHIEFDDNSYFVIPFTNTPAQRQKAAWDAYCYCQEAGGGSCDAQPSGNTVSCTPFACLRCALIICFDRISGGGILVKADRVVID